MISTFIKKTFNIRDGELKIALSMQFYIFLVITVLLLIKPTITALFLSNLGAQKLPNAYLLVAVIAMSSSLFYNWLVLKFSIKWIASTTILFFSIAFFILVYFIENNAISEFILYFYYLILSLFGVVVTSQFWYIANIVFNVREAKRLFGFIGAGAITGGIIGGYLTTLITTYFGNAMVIFIAAIIILLSLPLIFFIWKTKVDNNGNNEVVNEEYKTKKVPLFSSSLKLILDSKHLSNLALIVGVSVLVAKLVDYQFNDYTHRIYTDPDELASFFGFWFSSFNIVALLIQLFLTNKLLSRFGVNSNLLLLPMGLAIGSLIFIIIPELWVIILIKGTDISLKQSINKSAYELSILPIPNETKQLTKPFLDVVVDSMATGAAGVLLLLLLKGFHIDSKYITIILLFFLFIWILLIYRLRENYFNSFRKNIRLLISGTVNKKNNKIIDSKTSIIDVFRKGDEKEILRLLHHSDKNFIDVYLPYLVGLLDHPSNRVKATALQDIHSIKSKTIFKKVNTLIENNDDDKVVYEAMEYFLSYSTQNQNMVFHDYLNDKKYLKKNAALLCLAKASRNNKALGQKYELNKRIKDQIEYLSIDENLQRREDIAELLITIAYTGDITFDYYLEKHLNSKDSLLVKYAIRAVGLSKHEIFIDKIGKLITQEKYRNYVIKSLQEFGEPIVKILYKKDEEKEISDDIRIYIPRIIEVFNSKQTVVVLSHLLNSKEVAVRLNASRVLNDIEEQNRANTIPNKKLIEFFNNECDYYKNILIGIYIIEKGIKEIGEKLFNISKDKMEEQSSRDILKNHLIKQANNSLESIFYLLSLRYKDSDMEVVLLGIKNDTERSRINAIEFLENLLSSDYKNKLMPLLEYNFLYNTKAIPDRDNITESEYLLTLLDAMGTETIILVLKLIQHTKKPSFDKPVKELESHLNSQVRALAKKYFIS